MTPTPEQQSILEAAHRPGNLIINALAGAAKTTTLEMIAKELRSAPILSLAFNKRIQEEMEKRLPDHVASQTLNGLGHRAWARSVGKRQLRLDSGKSRRLLKAELEKIGRIARADEYERFSETLALIRTAKIAGYVPDGAFSVRGLTDSIPWEEEIDRPQLRLVDLVLRAGIAESFDGTIDFDDQIYMPTLFNGAFPRYSLVLIDEAQDLSSINHAMLRRLVSQRVIAVGDPWQSIYGFRGSVSGGMALLSSTFGCDEHGLSVSFRCPRRVVEHARRRVPHFQWRPGAPDGSVEWMEEWSSENIPDGAAIICRNNAPLFSLGFRLLRHGRRSKFSGVDIGPQLVKILRGLGDGGLAQEKVLAAIDRWEAAQLTKTKSADAVRDRGECLRIFATQGINLGAAVAYAEALLAQEGPIQLLSGHKAKGLEWDTVFHLDPWRIPSKWATTHEEIEQEKNVDYVITTRAKSRLVHVNLEDFS